LVNAENTIDTGI